MKGKVRQSIFLIVVILSLVYPHMAIGQGGTPGIRHRKQLPSSPNKQPPVTPSSGPTPQTPSSGPIPQPPSSAAMSQPRSGPATLQPANDPHSERVSDGHSLEARIYALEAGRADLSAWASLFIGIVTVVLGANVVFSAAQASSLGRAEIAKIIKKYDKQFSGFLTHNEEFVSTKIAEYEKSIIDLSHHLDEMTTTANSYQKDSVAAITAIQEAVDAGLERLRREAERLRENMRESS